MRVLVLDGGARGAALAWQIRKSPLCDELVRAPGNGQEIGENIDIDIKDANAVIRLVERRGIDFTVIGPEDPLAAGLADRLRERGHLVFGPSAAAARLESSKAFARSIAHKHGVPSPRHASFTDAVAARTFADSFPNGCVVKADGLAGGKGAIVCETLEQARRAIDALMIEGRFSGAGRTVVIEERLSGPEVSFFVLTDGSTRHLCPLAMDHKRRYKDNKGPNTSGMGAIAPVPSFTSPHHASYLDRRMMRPVIEGMAKAGTPFSGCLFGGMMMTEGGPRLLEYNVRFGDPEIIPVLRMFEEGQDLLQQLLACANGTLGTIPPLRWRTGYAACVVLVGKDYPEASSRGALIQGIDRAGEIEDVVVFHGGTRREGNQVYTNGGRILAVSAWGKTLREALTKTYTAIPFISFEGMDYRDDIGGSFETLWDL